MRASEKRHLLHYFVVHFFVHIKLKSFWCCRLQLQIQLSVDIVVPLSLQVGDPSATYAQTVLVKMEGILPLRTEPRGIVMGTNRQLILDCDWTFSRGCESEISTLILRHVLNYFHNMFSESTNIHVMDTASIIKTWLPQLKGSAFKACFMIPGLGAGVLLPHSASWVCRWNSNWVRTSASGKNKPSSLWC